MKTLRLLPVLAFLFTLPAITSEDKKEEFRPLFNGKNLDGWVKVNTAPSTWTVKDGMIICTGKPTGELRTTRMYQNFIMEVEWRHMKPRGNAGIFVWADDITARGQPFHRGVEVQVLENSYGNTRGYTTHGDIFPIHGAKMTPINGRGGSRAFPTENRSKPTPEWNHYRITCNDGTISLAVNGKVVTNGKNASPRKGYICLESEGGIVHYRNLRIRELPDTPLEPGQTAIADRGYRCIYTGVDLSGWESAGKGWQSRNWTFRYTGKSKADDKSLVTTESFSDFGFIFDVQTPKKLATCKVLLRDSAIAAITIDSTLKSKGWNRFEGELRGDKLSLKLNGRQLFTDKKLAGVATKGPIRIIPGGPIGFANVYIRTLEP
ncbi:MAG: DUF1080 domain-containing protein [Planctomycetota bacterium]|nr:DUF1080 domain-containing protein [Planctomycetota bacterium]